MKTAKEILSGGEYTCVLCKDDIIITSNKRGVAPLVELLDSKTPTKDFCAADKVVGRAAAFLYVLLEVKSVHANVLSIPALKVFKVFNIDVTYDTLCDYIENRQKNGRCPMESAVLDIEGPDAALSAIRQKMEELRK
ncbi:MAG: DUF1893 domain-containing protein [Clostridia bacterium]|nr:DUF1893 domain-containing protein [Clostridia bacterium]